MKRYTLLALTSVFGALTCLSGCTHPGSSSGSGNSGPAPGPSLDLSGNWEFHATPAQGSSLPFTVLSGFLAQQGTDKDVNFTTASLQVQSSGCYAASPDLSFQGSVQGKQLGLMSFSSAGQVLTVNEIADSDARHMNGTFAVAGGCTDGQHGQLQGTFYQPLNGNYNGPVTGAANLITGMHLTLAQSGGTADGLFFVTGTATFSGSACFTKGNLAYTNGYVSGSSFHLLLDTDETSGSRVAVIGTLDPAAVTLTITSISVVGGNCAGSAGVATLTS